MKRIFSVLVVTALMVAMLMASAMPAFADANPAHASCIGALSSGFAPETGGQTVGENYSSSAKDGGLGRFFSKENRGNYYTGPNC